MKEIEIIIDQDGKASIDMLGWEGRGCGTVADKLTKALGKTIHSDKKCEYYRTETKTKSKQQVRRG